MKVTEEGQNGWSSRASSSKRKTVLENKQVELTRQRKTLKWEKSIQLLVFLTKKVNL